MKKLNWKLPAGVLVMSVAAYALFENVVRTVASEAFVNAPVIDIQSPIPGRIRVALGEVGTAVPPSSQLVVENRLLDEGPLKDLQLRLAEIDGELDRLATQDADLADAQRDYAQAVSIFLAARSKFIQEQTKEAEAEAAARIAKVEDLQDRLSRLERMQAGNVTNRELVALRSEIRMAQNEQRAVEARMQGFSVVREALHDGVLVTETWSDRPYSGQRVMEIEQKRREIAARRSELKATRTSVETALMKQKDLTEQMRVARVPVPLGVVWRRAYEDTYVQSGGFLGTVAVCEDVVLTATLTRRDFERLYVGMPAKARVEITGKPTVVLNGQVRSLIGPSTQSSMTMAIPFGRAAKDDGYGAVIALTDKAPLDCRIAAPAKIEFGDHLSWWPY